MEQKKFELLVDQYILSLETSNLTIQMKIYKELEKLVKSGIEIDSESDFMKELSRNKPSLHTQILEWQVANIDASPSCASLIPR